MQKKDLIYFSTKYINHLLSAVVDLQEKEDTPENQWKFCEKIADGAIQLILDCGYSSEINENTVKITKPECPDGDSHGKTE